MKPIEKMKILVLLAITASCQSELQTFSLKKSVNVANYKGNIFHGHFILKKQPVEAEESNITRFTVQNGAWTRQMLHTQHCCQDPTARVRPNQGVGESLMASELT